MSYADITFSDKNLIKRWLQNQRLFSAIKLCNPLSTPDAICDFGSGNGELCKLLVERYPSSKITCYEPTPNLLTEAQENLNIFTNIQFCQDIRSVSHGAFDVVFCLEVFEHLPSVETTDAIQIISNLLKRDGVIIIGVPVETGIPALYKGIFRMLRRYGAFDANIKNVLLASFGHPPKNRPVSEIAPGFKFHFEHMGFHAQIFKQVLSSHFQLQKVSHSPFASFGTWLMPEVYFVAQKAS